MVAPNNNLNFDDELLSAYIDGELTVEERAAVEARLAADPAARELVAELESLSGSLRSMPKLPVAEDVRAAVLSQVQDKKQATLPEYRMGPLRRLMWPAVAIAAALMLIFTQGNREENVDLAKVEEHGAKIEGHDGEVRGRGINRDDAAVERPALTFDAPEEDRAPMADVPATVDATSTPPETSVATSAAPAEEPVIVGEGRVDDFAGRGGFGVEPGMSGRMSEAIAEAGVNGDLGIVHLTLTDLRSGAEQFDQLLVSNGVQVVEDSNSPATSEPMAETTVATDAVGTPQTFSARGGAGGAIFDGAVRSETAEEPAAEQSVVEEPEMVLVEAPAKQIEAILLGCANDTATIESVAIDPTASGTNREPTKQRLSGYQQYSRGKASREQAKLYGMTPEQQGVISVLNSLPPAQQSARSESTPAAPALSVNESQSANKSQVANEPQGWATKFRAAQQPQELEQLGTEVNSRRNLYYGASRQQNMPADKKLAKEEVPAEEPMRVLFLLHPSEASPAKK